MRSHRRRKAAWAHHPCLYRGRGTISASSFDCGGTIVRTYTPKDRVPIIFDEQHISTSPVVARYYPGDEPQESLCRSKRPWRANRLPRPTITMHWISAVDVTFLGFLSKRRLENSFTGAQERLIVKSLLTPEAVPGR